MCKVSREQLSVLKQRAWRVRGGDGTPGSITAVSVHCTHWSKCPTTIILSSLQQ